MKQLSDVIDVMSPSFNKFLPHPSGVQPKEPRIYVLKSFAPIIPPYATSLYAGKLMMNMADPKVNVLQVIFYALNRTADMAGMYHQLVNTECLWFEYYVVL